MTMNKVQQFFRRGCLYLKMTCMLVSVWWEARHFLYFERLPDGAATAKYKKVARQSELLLKQKVRGGSVTIANVFDHSATSCTSETDALIAKEYLIEQSAVALAWAAVRDRKQEPPMLKAAEPPASSRIDLDVTVSKTQSEV